MRVGQCRLRAGGPHQPFDRAPGSAMVSRAPISTTAVIDGIVQQEA